MPLVPNNASALETIYWCSNVVLVLISAYAIYVAFQTIDANREIQREQTARNAYIKYIELAFHNPEFAEPDWEKINLVEETFDSPDNPERKKSDGPEREERFARYCWFVSIMMNTAHLVFTAKPKDPVRQEEDRVRQDLMILQIAYHWKYIEYIKEREKYLVYRYKQHPKQIDEGIRLGKELEERGELEKKERLKEKRRLEDKGIS
jgi:hypothetical protein